MPPLEGHMTCNNQVSTTTSAQILLRRKEFASGLHIYYNIWTIYEQASKPGFYNLQYLLGFRLYLVQLTCELNYLSASNSCYPTLVQNQSHLLLVKFY